MVEVYPWFVGEVPLGDAMKGLNDDDAACWRWLGRSWDGVSASPRDHAARRVVDAIWERAEVSVPAFRALYERAESFDERLYVVERWYREVSWKGEAGRAGVVWVEAEARAHPGVAEVLRYVRKLGTLRDW